MLRAGPEGFKGGLSAGKYAAMIKTSTATATRDLSEMVELGALSRTGELRHTRYQLSIPLRSVPHLAIDASGEVAAHPRSG
jgi:DNA-binding IclR family transcriptional regulator